MQPTEAADRRRLVTRQVTERFRASTVVSKVLYPPEFHRRRLKRLMFRGKLG